MLGRWNSSNGLIIAAALLLVAAFDVSQARVREIPPLFRDDPILHSEMQLSITPAAEDDDYRLPNNTVPVHYDVELWTNVHTGETAFQGIVKIHLTALEDTRTIVLHARNLSDFRATIRPEGDTTATEEPMSIEYEEEREFLSLTPEREDLSLTRDSNWVLTIEYNGLLRTDNAGFYVSTYTDALENIRFLATTQFESTDARHGFPCYDEPAKRATFDISIHHDASYSAISNMPVNETLSEPGFTVFDTTPSMPTYLVAYIVSDFEFSEGLLNDLPQRVYSRPGTRHEQDFALVSGMLIIKGLSDYYNVSFSLPKMDQVGVPDFAAGAMENWGLVTYREEYSLYNPKTSTINTQTNIASIIAHEFCHQWFGNLVAIKFWTYLWLKEGFATLFSYRGMDEAYPEWDVYQMMQVSDYASALTVDASPNSRPMTHYVQTPREISSLYDSISYAKAGSVLYMFQQALTDRVFQRGLYNYLTVNQYSAAEEWQLFVAIQNAAKEEDYAIPATIDEMMSSWTQQSNFPLLTVERNYDDNSFTITQTAYFDNTTLSSDKLWYVPLNYATQSNMDFRNTEATHYMLKEKQIKITDSELDANDWLILNKQSTGLYRINYDQRNWELIISGLQDRPHKIHPRNRAQLMNDANKFTSTSRLDHHVLLNLMTYLTAEDQYAPWSIANSILVNYNRYLSGDEHYYLVRTYITRLVENIYDKLGVYDIPGEQHLQKLTRNVAINLACLAGIPSCLNEMNNKLKDLIENGIPIEPNLKTRTYCNGLQQSGDKEFDFVYNQLMDSQDQAERRNLISALGCAQKEEHIMKFISSSIDQTNSLRAQERTTLLSASYSSGEPGLLACIDFLDNNWQEYEALTTNFGGRNPLAADLQGMSQYVNNQNLEQLLMDLTAKIKPQSEAVTDALEATMRSNIQANFNWLATNRDPLINWMNEYFNSSAAVSGISLITICGALVVLFSRHF